MSDTRQAEIEKKITKTGTTTVGIKARDAVILAADQKATMGSLVANKDAQKVYQVSDHIGMTWAGSVGDALTFFKFVQAQARTHYLEYNKEMDVKQLSSFAATVLNYNRYFPYFIQVVLGGFTGKHPQLFNIDPVGGLMEEKEYTSTGSGSVTAYGVLEDRYSKDLTIDEAKEIAVRAVRASKERDIYSGGKSTTLVVITKKGYEEVDSEEIEAIIKQEKEKQKK